MRNVFSAILFAVIFIGLGALVFASAPVGNTDIAVQPDAPEAAVVAGAPQVAVAAVGNFNGITYVLDGGLGFADDLLADVNSTTGVTATSVSYYDPVNGLITRDPVNPFSTNFALTVGMPLLVRAQGSLADTYTIVGNVPAQGSVTFFLDHTAGGCTWNYISLPLDQAAITNSTELMADIDTGGETVSKAGYYDPVNGLITHDPGNPFTAQFDTKIGYPYFVCITADKTWPVYP